MAHRCLFLLFKYTGGAILDTIFDRMSVKDLLIQYAVEIIGALILLYESSEIDFSIFENHTKYKLKLLQSAYEELENTKERKKVKDIITRCDLILNSKK
jgi:hypothetical protein